MENQEQNKYGREDAQPKGDGKEFQGHSFRSSEEAQKDRETPTDFDFDKEKNFQPGPEKDN